MHFDYEALVGHLYVVGGRSISAAPPGSLVEVAPRKAARGRESDTFFVLVMPSGDVPGPAAFYEQMAHYSAESYFSSTGSVTAGLRSVFSTINQNLFDHNATDSRRYEASLVCAVLRGADLYLGKVGAGVAVLDNDGELIPFPAGFDNDDALYGAPLGVSAEPDVKMAHYQVDTGSRLLISDNNLADIDINKIQAALQLDDIGTVLVALKELIAVQVSLLAAEFVPPEVAAQVPVREVESTAEVTSIAPKPVVEPPPTSDTEGDEDEVDEPAPVPRPRERVPSPLIVSAQSAVGKGALGVSKAAGMAGRALDRMMPPPKEGTKRRWWSTPLTAGLAILIPVVVVVAVLIAWLSGTGQSEFELCVDQANDAAKVARAISSADVSGTTSAWNAVITVVDRCSKMHTGDPALTALTTEGRTIIDRLLQVDRRAVAPIVALPNASLTRLVLQGEDLYALDSLNDLVYRVKLTPDGTAIVPANTQAIPSMRRTASVAEFTVGNLIDIAWATNGNGLSQGNELIALDRNGVLIECPPRFLDTISCDAQQLAGTDVWVHPTSIGVWTNGSLYLLDPQGNQLWRYEPSGGAFTSPPTEYFVGDDRPDITTAVDFGIDDKGQVYVLLQDGRLLRFNGGTAIPFGWAGFPEGQQITDVSGMFLNNNPIAQGLFVIDKDNRTIYETTLAGTFLASYRAQNESLFTSISEVTVDSNQRMVYASSGNSILAFTRSTQ